MSKSNNLKQLAPGNVNSALLNSANPFEKAVANQALHIRNQLQIHDRPLSEGELINYFLEHGTGNYILLFNVQNEEFKNIYRAISAEQLTKEKFSCSVDATVEKSDLTQRGQSFEQNHNKITAEAPKKDELENSKYLKFSEQETVYIQRNAQQKMSGLNMQDNYKYPVNNFENNPFYHSYNNASQYSNVNELLRTGNLSKSDLSEIEIRMAKWPAQKLAALAHDLLKFDLDEPNLLGVIIDLMKQAESD